MRSVREVAEVVVAHADVANLPNRNLTSLALAIDELRLALRNRTPAESVYWELDQRLMILEERIAQIPAIDRWMSSKEAAEYLGISRNALHKHMASRTIPFEQEGPGCKCWFKASELDDWRRGSAT